MHGGKAVPSPRALCAQSRYPPPSDLPLDSAHLRVTQVTAQKRRDAVYDSLRHYVSHNIGGKERAATGRARPAGLLILFFPGFLAATLASERFFNALLFAGLQIEGVVLDLLDDVFLLHLAFKATQRILEGFALLKSDFGQPTTPPNSSRWTR
jgi:hypothetical protein